MAFHIRLHRRVSVICPVTYETRHACGEGTLCNLSRNGFRFSGDLFLLKGETCSLIVNLPNQQRVRVAAAVVRWSRDPDEMNGTWEYGVETLVTNVIVQKQLSHYVAKRAGHGRPAIFPNMVPLTMKRGPGDSMSKWMWTIIEVGHRIAKKTMH